MACYPNVPFCIPWSKNGIKVINAVGDGYTISMTWHQAYTRPDTYNIAYNIYYSSTQGDAISEGPKFVSTNNDTLLANVVDFIPGDTYFFVIRATQYDPSWYNIELLPTDDAQTDGYLHTYPETLLASDITDEDTTIPITDADIFPGTGVIQVGYELIRYSGKDNPNNLLFASERGFLSSNARLHQTDGYDGYGYRDPVVRFWVGLEEPNLNITQEQNTFNFDYNIYTVADGYRIADQEGILTTDLGDHDSNTIDFPPYDFAGWHRTDPKLFFNGKCQDTYIGGEHFCADGYLGANRQIRNISLSDQAARLQEMMLEQMGTGSQVMLLRRLWKGITCSCYEPNQEYPDHRCHVCHGTGFVTGYEQYFYPRRSDGRILVRFGPAVEDLKMEEAGLENHVIFDCWTLTVPTIRDRDVLIRFNPDGTEEFRYEVLDVTRNRLLFNEIGNQHFRVQRVRKTSPIYQWKAIRNTSLLPQTIGTTVGLLRGPNNVPIPHTHDIVINENVLVLSQINQTTSMSADHNHEVRAGVVQSSGLGHTHEIVLP